MSVMRHRVAGWQLNAAGGNLVTGPGYSMDPLTGEWGLNAFPDRTDERQRDEPSLRGWIRCHCVDRWRGRHHDAPAELAA